jgi:hypothetical protein
VSRFKCRLAGNTWALLPFIFTSILILIAKQRSIYSILHGRPNRSLKGEQTRVPDGYTCRDSRSYIKQPSSFSKCPHGPLRGMASCRKWPIQEVVCCFSHGQKNYRHVWEFLSCHRSVETHLANLGWTVYDSVASLDGRQGTIALRHVSQEYQTSSRPPGSADSRTLRYIKLPQQFNTCPRHVW